MRHEPAAGRHATELREAQRAVRAHAGGSALTTYAVDVARVWMRDAGIPGAERMDVRQVHATMAPLQRDAIRLGRDVEHHLRLLAVARTTRSCRAESPRDPARVGVDRTRSAFPSGRCTENVSIC